MSKQKMADLRQKLERWKSHNEVNAKPADAILYEFLSDILNLADVDEPERLHSVVADATNGDVTISLPELNVENEINDSVEQQDDEVGDTGGNNPPHKPGTP